MTTEEPEAQEGEITPQEDEAEAPPAKVQEPL